MSRYIPGMTIAVVCALTLGVQAQDQKTKTTTKIEGKDAKTITYTGCVRTGPEVQTYTLDQAVPVSRTTEVGTSGQVSTTTNYVLVPGESVTFEKYVGHKVEVTGMMMPGGDSKIETETKIEREHAPDVTIKEKTKNDDAMPHFRVLSVKQLSDTCS